MELPVSARSYLSRLAVLSFTGPDALDFVHGQFSNIVPGASEQRANPAAWCTARGRLLANGILWQMPAGGICMIVANDLAGQMLARLAIYRLRARVELAQVQDASVYGVQGADAVPAGLHGMSAWACLASPADTWILAPFAQPNRPAAWHVTTAEGLEDSPVNSSTHDRDSQAAQPESAWDARRLAAGWPMVHAAAQELFLPSTLNMDLNGSIDFRKGCYPGQEIIARSHYRGTVKRRLAHACGPWPATAAIPAPGTDIFPQEPDSKVRAIGRVIEAVRHEGALHLAAECAVMDEAPASIFLADGPSLALHMIV